MTPPHSLIEIFVISTGKLMLARSLLLLFYDELNKPSCLVITKLLCAKQNKVSGLSTILTSFLCKATP